MELRWTSYHIWFWRNHTIFRRDSNLETTTRGQCVCVWLTVWLLLVSLEVPQCESVCCIAPVAPVAQVAQTPKLEVGSISPATRTVFKTMNGTLHTHIRRFEGVNFSIKIDRQHTHTNTHILAAYLFFYYFLEGICKSQVTWICSWTENTRMQLISPGKNWKLWRLLIVLPAAVGVQSSLSEGFIFFHGDNVVF